MNGYRILGLCAWGAMAIGLSGVARADEYGAKAKGGDWEKTGQMQSAGKAEASVPELCHANRHIGEIVRNDKGEPLGRIEDALLDSGRSRFVFAVISVGTTPGSEAKLTAVPLSCFEPSADKKSFILRTDMATLKTAPSFERSNWPSMTNSDWFCNAKAFYMRKTAQAEGGAKEREKGESSEMHARHERARFQRLTEVIGTRVKNRQGEYLGTIEDVIGAGKHGDIAYATISLPEPTGLFAKPSESERMAAVPWTALEMTPRQGMARLDADRKMLDAIAYRVGEQPNLADPSYVRRVHDELGLEPYWEVFGYITPETRGHMEAAWLAGSDYNKHFKAGSMETFNGTIEGIGSFLPAPDAAVGLRLRVKTSDGKWMTVQVGPRSFAHKNNVYPHYGDQVRVTGSKTQVGDCPVVMATEIQVGEQTLRVRYKDGRPLWTADDIR